MLRILVGICAGLTVLHPCCAPVSAGETGRVEFKIQDENKNLLPCRIHLKNAAGEPLMQNVLDQVVTSVNRGTQGSGKAPTFRDHFVCGGTATLDLPAGTYSFEIERGPEYRPFTGNVTAGGAGAAQVSADLARITNLATEGYWSGDLHVHRDLRDIELLMQAEDLNVAPVLTWWNNRNQWQRKALPENTLVHFDGNRFYDVMGGEDERGGGALLFFHLKEPLPVAGSEREYPSPMKYVDMARQHKGVWIDIEKPFWWDVPTWLASGAMQSLGIANNHMTRSWMYPGEAWGKPRDEARLPLPHGNALWTQEIYYHILNSGLRISPSAGSASGVLPNPVGYNRVYVHAGDELSWRGWWDGLRAGRVFVTNGPLLRVTANGALPGHVFSAVENQSVDVDLRVAVDSNDPISAVNVIVNGEVERVVPFKAAQETGGLGKLHFEHSGWFLVTAITEKKDVFRFASTGPYYVEVGASARRISRESAQFFVDWVQERMDRLTLPDDAQRAEVLKPHEQALAFWKDVLERANAD